MPVKSSPLPPGALAGSVLMAKDAAGIAWDPLVQVGFMDIFGHSHMSDNVGASAPDFGVAHKIDGLLQPATYRNVALSGGVHSFDDQGNGAPGDGGWAHVAGELRRDEQVTGKGATTSSGAYSAPNAPVNARDNFLPGEYVVWGTGASTEIVQIASTYVAATGAGNIALAAAPVNAHVSGDPFYHACRNEGWLAKSSMVLGGVGLNDLSYLGPRNTVSLDSLVFGTNPGASRGLDPFKHALRFTCAQLRSSVIYKDTHPIFTYSGSPAWTSAPATSAASYPPISTLLSSTGNLNFHYAQANGATISFSTPPDFPGGTVACFFLAYAGGQGTLWSFAVTGATTITSNNAHDNRAANAVTENDVVGLTTGRYTGTCYRITGLNAGVNNITITASTVSTYAIFLGAGFEPTTSLPIVFLLQDPRATTIGYALYAQTPFGYGPRAFAGAKTATVAANAGTAAGSVTLGSAITQGVAGTISATAVQPGDTITIGAGATQETRRVVATDSTTTLHVDSNFLNAHTGEACQIGMQDADIVGGGYSNTADTQGKTSVPGLVAATTAIAGEFPASGVDPGVTVVSLDLLINPQGSGSVADSTAFCSDGIHYNDKGSAAIAAGIYQKLLVMPFTIPQIASPTVPNKRTYLGVYGDAGATPASGQPVVFVNGWTNEFPSNGNYPRTSYYKEMRTRVVYVRGAVTAGAAVSAIFALPIGYVPSYLMQLNAYTVEEDGTYGSALVYVLPSGQVWCAAGYPGTTGILVFSGSWLAEQ